ncbi:MAG: DNA alkylation repair protein [Patescibacteria group bacterium]|jgi:3-methyladenine DNA glycosylase AlkD
MTKINILPAIEQDLRCAADPAKALVLLRFFKTGPGEYGEGDTFLGIVVPEIRKLVKKYASLPLGQVQRLLRSKYHEARLLALLILVRQFERGGETARKKIFDLYLANTGRINNWDLVDLSAPNIVGEYLLDRPKKTLLELAGSQSLWERRIAMLATFAEIKRGRPDTALRLAKKLLRNDHDLIRKAVGWMLREVGKRCSQKTLEDFLDRHAAEMPRTMLRYAIERLPTRQRRRYLAAR